MSFKSFRRSDVYLGLQQWHLFAISVVSVSVMLVRTGQFLAVLHSSASPHHGDYGEPQCGVWFLCCWHGLVPPKAARQRQGGFVGEARIK